MADVRIIENLRAVRQKIERCCDRSARRIEDVELVCVTKEATVNKIEEVLNLGIKVLGENRVNEACEKYRYIGDRASWHLVGHLQTNKVKDAVKIFSLIHSVDSVRLAKKISEEAGKLGKVQDILVEVNTSGEETKFGISPEETPNFINEIVLYPNIILKGLMTIAPETDDPQKARPFFRILRQLRDEINRVRDTQYTIHILSMGMSGDFEVAIEEGSNMVRVGRAIFGAYSKKNYA